MKTLLLSAALMLATSSLIAYGQRQGNGKTQLLDIADVQGDNIRLSDLLPPEASIALRKAAAEITLGHAPELGNSRSLEAQQIRRAVAQPELLGGLAIPARVEIRHEGFALSRALIRGSVAQFLRLQGLSLPPGAGLSWPNSIASAHEKPALEAESAKWNNQQGAGDFWLRCIDHRECGAFVVEVTCSCFFESDWRALDATHQKAKLALRSKHPETEATHSAILIQAGRPAMLVLHDEGMKISMQVICLERGELSQSVRVMDPHTHHIFHAQVTGPAALEAQL